MPFVLDVDAQVGKAAIYSVTAGNENDDSPLTDPLANLARVKFHTDFRYPKIVDDRSGSLSFSQILAGPGAPNRGINTVNLFAHGRAGLPFIIGAINAPNFQNNFSWGPLGAGTMLNGIGPRNRIVSLGVTATHVVLRTNNHLGGNQISPAVTIGWRVLVTDELL